MANRFWVGGTGTWDASDTTHWASTTGGAGGASVPGTADAVILDASSGGGTVTPSADIAVQSITCGAFTGTLDFSTNNNNATLSASAGFSMSGSGTRTIKLGSGAFNFTSTASSGVRFNAATVTNLTFDAGTSVLKFARPLLGNAQITGGGQTYATIECLGGTSETGQFLIQTAGNIIGTLKLNGKSSVTLPVDQTINAIDTSVLAVSAQAYLGAPQANGGTDITKASGSIAMNWVALEGLNFTGGATFAATNSFDLGGNSGITITPPITVQPICAVGI